MQIVAGSLKRRLFCSAKGSAPTERETRQHCRWRGLFVEHRRLRRDPRLRAEVEPSVLHTFQGRSGHQHSLVSLLLLLPGSRTPSAAASCASSTPSPVGCEQPSPLPNSSGSRPMRKSRFTEEQIAGTAIGVVCVSGGKYGEVHTEGGPNARLAYHLPRWLAPQPRPRL